MVTLIAAFLAAAVGCGGENIKTYTNTGDTIEVKVNGEFVIALDSNPTTGYSWMPVYQNAEFELVADNYEQDPTDGMVLGAGGTQYLRFKALKEGVFKITLNYQRAIGGEADNKAVFNINVS